MFILVNFLLPNLVDYKNNSYPTNIELLKKEDSKMLRGRSNLLILDLKE